MKKLIACLLVLVLTMSFSVCVAAEEVNDAEQTVSTTIPQTETTENLQDEVFGQAEIGVKEYAEEMGQAEASVGEYAEDMDQAEVSVKEYAEEDGGFFGWLKNLWKAILSFFGL